MSLAATVALQNFTRRSFTRKVHIEKNLYRGGFAGIYWKYTIFSVFFADRDNFFVHWDQEGWRDDSTVDNPLSEHIFQNVHNFVNNLVQFSAQIVFNCEARRLDPFVGSAYKNTNIFHQRYSMVQQTGPARNGWVFGEQRLSNVRLPDGRAQIGHKKRLDEHDRHVLQQSKLPVQKHRG